MAGVHGEWQALSLQAARDPPPRRLRSRRASSASGRLEPEAVTQDTFLRSQSLGLYISCTLGRTSQVEGTRQAPDSLQGAPTPPALRALPSLASSWILF